MLKGFLREKKLATAAGIISVLGMLIMIGVNVIASTYTVMIADDFWYAKMTGRYTNFFEYLKLSWDYMIYEYKYYQGTYFSEFFCALFNPVSWNSYPLLRAMMIINCIISFGALMFLVYVVMDDVFEGHLSLKMVILACVVFTMTQYDAFQEIFFWYIGAGVYSYPLALAFLAIAFFILANRSDTKHKKGLMIAAGILGVLGVGGSLAISGMVTYLVLVLVFYYWISGKKGDKSNITMFVLCFLGSLISTIAPGNFARQSVETSQEISLAKTFADTLQVYCDNVKFLFVQRNFEIILLIVIVCGMIAADAVKIDKKNWLIAGILLVFMPFIAIFPVVLGYNVAWIPNRCAYIAITAFCLFFINMAFYLGTVLGKSIKSKKTVVVCAASAIAVVLLFTDSFSIRDFKTVRHIKNLYDGVYQTNYAQTRELLENLENREGEDVELDVTTNPNIIENYYSFYMPNEKDSFINVAVSWVYNLNSVVSIREDGE
jgi:hypothetical protein